MELENMIMELEHVLTQINAQIDSVQAYAVGEGVRASELKNTNGTWVMIDLLAAKATALSAIARLQRDVFIQRSNAEHFERAMAEGRMFPAVFNVNQTFEKDEDEE